MFESGLGREKSLVYITGYFRTIWGIMLPLTQYFPSAIGQVRRQIDRVTVWCEVDFAAVVSPRTERNRAVLIVERKPGYVDGTHRDETTKRDPRTSPVRIHDDVRQKRTVDLFVSTT